MLFGGAGGVALARFPGVSELSSNPGRVSHGLAAYGGAHAGIIGESAKFVGGELIERDRNGAMGEPKNYARAGMEDPQDILTEEDLILGKRTTRFMANYTIIALFLCVGMAVFTFLNVPWDIRMP